MSRNRSNFVRVMGTASAVVLSSTLAVPAVAIAADVDEGAQLSEQSLVEAEKEAAKVVEAIKKVPADPTQDYEAFKAAEKAVVDYFVRFAPEIDTEDWFDNEYTANDYTELITNADDLRDAATKIREAQDLLEKAKTAIGDVTKDPSTITSLDDPQVAIIEDARDALDAYDDAVHPNAKAYVSDKLREKLAKAEAQIAKLKGTAEGLLAVTNEAVEGALSNLDLAKVYAKTDDDALAKAEEAVKRAEEHIKLKDNGDIDPEVMSEDAGVKKLVDEVNELSASINQKKRDYLGAFGAVQETEAELKGLEEDEDADPQAIRDLQHRLRDLNKDLEERQKALQDEVAKKANLSEQQQKLLDNKDYLTAVKEAIANSPVENAARAIENARLEYFLSGGYDEEAAKFARELVDSLTEDQIKELDTTPAYMHYLDDLKEVEKQIEKQKKAEEAEKAKEEDRKAAEAVVAKIEALPGLADIESTDAAAINDAYDAYNALTDAQKDLISDADKEKLEDSKKLLDKLAPAPVVNAKVFRLYNPNSGEHFYTADAEEKDALVTMGWTNETSEDNAWTSADETGTPVYRLYNPNAQGGDHHFTTDAAEVEALVKAGWAKDNGGKPVFYSADAETGVAIYRAYNGNENAHNHNYTPDKAEQDALVAAGWADEGVAFYGAPLLKDAE